ncbi:MAG: hypothetical protein RLZZ519_1748 [Bacteroidota bacterium]|jgi:hypothetical protein
MTSGRAEPLLSFRRSEALVSFRGSEALVSFRQSAATRNLKAQIHPTLTSTTQTQNPFSSVEKQWVLRNPEISLPILGIEMTNSDARNDRLGSPLCHSEEAKPWCHSEEAKPLCHSEEAEPLCHSEEAQRRGI